MRYFGTALLTLSGRNRNVDDVVISEKVQRVLAEPEAEFEHELIDPANKMHQKAICYDPSSEYDDALDAD